MSLCQPLSRGAEFMRTYRVYCFDGASRIVSAQWLEAANDADAVIAAKKQMNCVRIEVWERDRRVGLYQIGEA